MHVVYLKQVDPFALSWYNPLPAEPLLLPRSTETKCRTDASSSSQKKGLTKPGSDRKKLPFL
nr:Ycf15 [Cycas szechuanensis]